MLDGLIEGPQGSIFFAQIFHFLLVLSEKVIEILLVFADVSLLELGRLLQLLDLPSVGLFPLLEVGLKLEAEVLHLLALLPLYYDFLFEAEDLLLSVPEFVLEGECFFPQLLKGLVSLTVY